MLRLLRATRAEIVWWICRVPRTRPPVGRIDESRDHKALDMDYLRVETRRRRKSTSCIHVKIKAAWLTRFSLRKCKTHSHAKHKKQNHFFHKIVVRLGRTKDTRQKVIFHVSPTRHPSNSQALSLFKPAIQKRRVCYPNLSPF